MKQTSKCETNNKWGESIYQVPLASHSDARYFTRLIGMNFTRFALIGCHGSHDSGWVVAYRTRKSSPWKGGVA